MAMNIFDLKAGSSRSSDAQSVTSVSKSKSSSYGMDFKKVLNRLQTDRIEHHKPLRASGHLHRKADVKELQANVSEIATSEPAVSQQAVETKISVDRTNASGEDKNQSSEIEKAALQIEEELRKHDPLIHDHGSTITPQETQTLHTDATDLLPIPGVTFVVAEVELNKSQQQALTEITHLAVQLQAALSGDTTVPEEQLLPMLSKLMNLLKENAHWLEKLQLVKPLPIAPLMLSLDQMLGGQDESFMQTLQKLLEQFMQAQKEMKANAQSQSAARLPNEAQGEAIKPGNTQPQSNATMNGQAVINEEKQTQAASANLQQQAPSATTGNTPPVQQAVSTQPASVGQEQMVNQAQQVPQPSAAPATQAASQSVTPHQLPQELQKMIKQFKFNKANGVSEARFSLNPDHLGHVNIKISVSNGQVVAQIYTDTAMAKETLEAQMLHLRAALQSNGLIVERLEVFNNQVLSQQFHEQRKQQQSQQFKQSSKQKSNDYVDLDEQLNELNQVKDPLKIGMGATLDVIA